jgi:DNA cross-link repair 1C protein
LHRQVHVDSYKLRIYQSLGGNLAGNSSIEPHLTREGPSLAGFKFGNQHHNGILTLDHSVKLHSCEKGTWCECNAANNTTVWIRPIIARVNGNDIIEKGIGGGAGDLTQRPELELHSDLIVQELMNM